MRNELILPQGLWKILESSDDASEAEKLTNTAIGFYFKHQLEHASNTAYYIFVDNDGKAPVCLAIGETFCPPGALVTGFRNSDPYVEYADIIKSLGDHLGVDLGPQCYPYSRPLVTNNEVGENAGPKI